MELLPVCCLVLLTWSGASGEGPQVEKLVVKEDEDAVLRCSLSTSSIVDELFDWKKDGRGEVFLYDRGSHYNNGRGGQDAQFKGRVSHFPEQLASGNASIVIRPAKVTDSGSYTCDFPSHQPVRRAVIELTVGAAPKPIITLHEKQDGVLLQCEVQGAFPKPTVEWWDPAGNILPAEEPQVNLRGDRYDVMLEMTVTKKDVYRCVSTQQKIHHQIHTETFVPGPENKPEERSSTESHGLLISVVVLSIVIILLILVLAREPLRKACGRRSML